MLHDERRQRRQKVKGGADTEREREREKRGRREGDELFQQLQLEALRVASRNFQFISHVYEYL